MTARFISKGFLIAAIIQATDVLSQNVVEDVSNRTPKLSSESNRTIAPSMSFIVEDAEPKLATLPDLKSEKETEKKLEHTVIEKSLTAPRADLDDTKYESDLQRDTDNSALTAEATAIARDSDPSEPVKSVMNDDLPGKANPPVSLSSVSAEDLVNEEAHVIVAQASEQLPSTGEIGDDPNLSEPHLQTAQLETQGEQIAQPEPKAPEQRINGFRESNPVQQISSEGSGENLAPLTAPTLSHVLQESKLDDDPHLVGQTVKASQISQIQKGDAILDALIIDWLGQTEVVAVTPESAMLEQVASEASIPEVKERLERIVTDDDLATAAANVRKSWLLMAPERIDNLIDEEDISTAPAMQIAMLASVIADVVGNLEFVKNAATPLVYIRGQSVLKPSVTTTTSTTRNSLSLLSGSALGLPFSLASRASKSFIGQAIGVGAPQIPNAGVSPLPTAAPTNLRSSPFSALWPNGAVPKLQSDDSAFMRASNQVRAKLIPAFNPGHPGVGQSAWNTYSTFNQRKLSELQPALQQEPKERFGNFLHDELPREIKRKIWDDFVYNSRRSRSAEEQNALLRKLEKGQDDVRTQSPPRRLIDPTARPITVAEKVAYGANRLRESIKGADFSVTLAEAARLFLATLEPESQTRLMKLLLDNGGKDDASFIGYKNTHDIDAELQIGLLLLTRLQNVLLKANILE